jgi:nuclear pore complex protein Nup98-Nup96
VDDSLGQNSSVCFNERSPASSSPDDTFQFRKKNVLPGAFNHGKTFGDSDAADDIEQLEESFFGEDIAGSTSDGSADELEEVQNGYVGTHDESLVIRDDEMDMAGSFPHGDLEDLVLNVNSGLSVPQSILKVDERGQIRYGTPAKFKLNPSSEWAEQLQRTVSPRKQDRQVLRQMQDSICDVHQDNFEHPPETKGKASGAEKSLATSIDLMNSLFGKEEARRSGRSEKKGVEAKGFKV